MGSALQRGTWDPCGESLVWGDILGVAGQGTQAFAVKKDPLCLSPSPLPCLQLRGEDPLCLSDPEDSQELKINLHFETVQLWREQT